MTTVIYICGLYTLIFALFHLGFWKIFKWERDLPNISDIASFDVDRRIMHILNIQMIWCFVAVAFICFAFPADLLSTKLGGAFLSCCSLFWLFRAVEQLFFFRGKIVVSLSFTLILLVGAVLFALPVFNGLF
jgi:hypothetical protein